ncbi:unnamed protein product, partial [marine sediment metagenome]
VAKNILCQFPTSTPAYWLQRFLITIINKGNWPFGYEYPISLRKSRRLFADNDYKIVDFTYHDAITGIIYKLSYKYSWIKPLKHKNFLNRIFMTDLVLYICEKNLDSE